MEVVRDLVVGVALVVSVLAQDFLSRLVQLIRSRLVVVALEALDLVGREQVVQMMVVRDQILYLAP